MDRKDFLDFIYRESIIGKKIRKIDKIIHRWNLEKDIPNNDKSDSASHIAHQDYLIGLFEDNIYYVVNIINYETLVDILRACYFKLFNHLLMNYQRYKLDIDLFLDNNNIFFEIIFQILLHININDENCFEMPDIEYHSLLSIILTLKETTKYSLFLEKLDQYKLKKIENFQKIIIKSEWSFWNVNSDNQTVENFLNYNNSVRFHRGIWEYHPDYIIEDKNFIEKNISKWINNLDTIINLFTD